MSIETIWAEYRSSLRAFLSKNVSNHADVDDLLQEVLIKSYHNLETIKDTKKLKSWLFQIANHTMIDFYRKRAKNQTSELQQEHDCALEETDDIFEQMTDCITPFIKGLSKDEAALLTAVELEGIAQKTYAEQQDIKYSTLKSRVQKSRQSLYALFNQCCDFQLDAKGNLVSYTRKNGHNGGGNC
ncbi:RNA polymerase sigma factor SigZ [Shewanella intestini]|uniref:RNA polymerase sigma factor n=1 Tax=Shewanella intestini TaxID=2017544 RepID=A0ABS5I470_9GAMM|nr:RNA polymerase sigma factor SigZ [Shewanella intestini]MRG36890.1 RNA polymerase sigma factor SigZ [Shewanella sp. XMDDZSB0408]